MPRKFDNWLETWEQYVNCSPSPLVFRKWTGIAALAGAMERKCWVKTYGKFMYPNLFILLISPPGVGKSFLIEIVADMWNRLGTHHVAPDSVSRASLADELKEAERHIVRPGYPTITFNSLLMAVEEFGTIMPSYEHEFMNTLNKWYDCGSYGERKRGTSLKYFLERPQINFLSGTQPSYLSHFLPEGAWEQGFMSRTILVYSGESIIGDLFDEGGMSTDLRNDLVHDLKLIGGICGPFVWTKEAASAMQKWHMDRGAPAPDHPKLVHYCTRRTSQLLKLCQIASINESDKQEITFEHFDIALSWLITAEYYMPDIFKAMAHGGDAQLIRECWHFVYKLYTHNNNKKPIQEFRIMRFLQERTPSHNVDKIMTMMVKGDFLQPEAVNKLGSCYSPKVLK